MTRFNQPISDANVEDLLDIQGVVSVGEGLHEGSRAIVVGIENESVASRLPGQIEGYPVVWDIEDRPGLADATLPILPENAADIPSTTAEYGGRVRPVPPGVSIAHTTITAGTSSFLMTDGDTIYQLSNNHVLARSNLAEVGDAILQPGPRDGGTMEDKVGELAGWVEIDPTSQDPNPVDAAWYEPTDGVELEEEINQLSEPTVDVTEPQIGDEVSFVGRTSGYQTGVVDRAHQAVEIGTSQHGYVIFTDLFRMDTPLIPGDSGSPIVIEDEDGPVPAGIGFAGNDSQGFCCYITNVEEKSGLSVMPVPAGDGPAAAGGGVGQLLLAAGIATGGYYTYKEYGN